MTKKTFETTMTWAAGGSFAARIEVGADGWGKVFDTADGFYCGFLNPIRTRQLMQEVAHGK